jgi:hypothetical protein
MDVPTWIIGLGILAALTIIIGSALLVIAQCFPATDGNRPLPPERMADLEQARDDALRKIAARQRRNQ